MYNILEISGANMMVGVGLTSMIISTAIIVLTSLKNWNDKTTRLVLRVLLITAFGLTF